MQQKAVLKHASEALQKEAKQELEHWRQPWAQQHSGSDFFQPRDNGLSAHHGQFNFKLQPDKARVGYCNQHYFADDNKLKDMPALK